MSTVVGYRFVAHSQYIITTRTTTTTTTTTIVGSGSATVSSTIMYVCYECVGGGLPMCCVVSLHKSVN